jgi:hypothetical protein
MFSIYVCIWSCLFLGYTFIFWSYLLCMRENMQPSSFWNWLTLMSSNYTHLPSNHRVPFFFMPE